MRNGLALFGPAPDFDVRFALKNHVVAEDPREAQPGGDFCRRRFLRQTGRDREKDEGEEESGFHVTWVPSGS